MSIPCSCAKRRAFGEILVPPDCPCSERPADGGVEGADTCVDLVLWLGWISCGALSPGRRIHAIVWPTGITAPTLAETPASTPSAGDSTSRTALSVSISSRGSPLDTLSPSFFRQATSLPASCAISRAGMTTLKGMSVRLVCDAYSFRFCALFNHLEHTL